MISSMSSLSIRPRSPIIVKKSFDDVTMGLKVNTLTSSFNLQSGSHGPERKKFPEEKKFPEDKKLLG
jgi:hypothetical protein